MGIQSLYDRNALYLSLAISPLWGFLLIDYNLILSIFFLFSLALGVSLASNCVNLIKVRIWISIFSFFSCYGFFIMQFWKATPLYWVGSFFLGMGTGGVVYSLPLLSLPNANYHVNASTRVIGMTLSMVIGFFWKELLERSTYFVLCICLVFTFLIIRKISPPSDLDDFSLCVEDEFLSRKRNGLLLLFCIFTLLMSFSVGTGAITIINSIQHGKFTSFLFAVGIVMGAFLCAFVSNRKGVYSASTLLIFLCEVSVSFSLYDCNRTIYFLSILSTALCIGCITTQPYLVSSFIIGRKTYCYWSKWVLFSELLGLALSIHAQLVPLFCKSDCNYSPIPLLLILVVCFFLFFYLWKKRLILLKS